MKKRYHFYIVAGVLLIGLILASFFDLQIEQALFKDRNAFGVTLSCLGTLPGYMGLGFLSGILFGIMLNRKANLAHRIGIMVIAVLTMGVGVYRQADEFTGVNGMNLPQYTWLGYVVSFALVGGLFVLGIFEGRKEHRDDLWIIILMMAAIMIVAVFGGFYFTKLIMRRPRYRIMVSEGLVDFTPWWERFKGYKDFIGMTSSKGYLITSEEFKSFPSGHACGSALMIMILSYLPFVYPKLQKHQTWLFYVGVAWMLLIMFSRITVGAHYLSDVCIGALILIVVFYIGNEILLTKLIKEE